MKQLTQKRTGLLIISWLVAVIWTMIVAFQFSPVLDLDHQFLNFLHVHSNENLTTFFYIITAMANPSTVIILSLTIVVALFIMRQNSLAIKAVIYILAGNLVLHLVKTLIARPRPLMQLVPAGGYSFPSGHTFNAALLAVIFWAIIATVLRGQRERVFIFSLLVLWVALVGLSRMYLQVHYPSDILGGLLYAWAWFETTEFLMHHLYRRPTQP